MILGLLQFKMRALSLIWKIKARQPNHRYAAWGGCTRSRPYIKQEHFAVFDSREMHFRANREYSRCFWMSFSFHWTKSLPIPVRTQANAESTFHFQTPRKSIARFDVLEQQLCLSRKAERTPLNLVTRSPNHTFVHYSASLLQYLTRER